MLKAISAAVAALLALPAMSLARTTLLYTTDASARQLAVAGGLSYCDADVLRLNRETRSADRATCSRFVPRVDADDLAGRQPVEIATILRSAIDRVPRRGGRPAHVVAVDEIGNQFRDPRPRVERRAVVLGGRTYRIASHHVVRRGAAGGWRIIRRRAPASDPPGRSHPGSRLARAMKLLARTPSPWGGSYASRVHFFAAPAMTTSVAAGHGPHFTLNETRTKEVRPGWRAVTPALARAGGVWLAMYHGDGTPLDARAWRLGPSRLGRYLERFGGSKGRLHFVIGGLSGAPPGASGCSSPMSCHWALAREPGNASILANGLGAWRLGAQAGEFAREHAAVFG